MNPNDLNAPVQQAQANTANLKNIFAGQQADTGNFLNRFTGAINSQPTSSALAQRIGDELGVPQLQGNATMLRNTLTNLPSTYSAATRGFDVNANQLSRIIGQKSSELAPAVDTAERSLSSAQNTLDRRLGYAQADNQKALLPYQSEQSLLSDRFAREASGYSDAMHSELDAIIAKMNAGITLSEGEKDRAQKLAIAEKGYQNQLDQIKQTAQSTKANQSRYITLGDGATLYDTQTGRVVSENSKNFKASGGGITPTLNNAGSFNWSQFGL